MNDLILVKSGALGTRKEMPKLNEGEFGYRTDTNELYIGTNEGNKRLCGVGDKAEINKNIGDVNVQINTIHASLESISTDIFKLNEELATINARLDALETPEAPSE